MKLIEKSLVIFMYVAITLATLYFSGSKAQAHYTGTQVVLESVYDGDTFKVMIEVYPDLFKRISIRLRGVDTPEAGWRAKCDSEVVAGDKATLWLRQKLSGAIIELDGLKHGKFARRMLAEVYVEGEYVNQMVIDVGNGRAYFGDKRGSWCGDDL